MPKYNSKQEVWLSTVNPGGLLDLLIEMGFSTHQILGVTSINPQMLTDSSSQITFHQYKQLIQRAISLTGNHAIGLDFGKRLNTTGFGILGIGFMACNTFVEAMHFTRRCAAVLNPAIEFKIHTDDNYLHVDVEEGCPWGDTEPFHVDVTFSVLTESVRLFSPEHIEQLKYQMKYPALPDVKSYQTHYQGEIQFCAHYNRISFPLAFAERSLPFQNPSAVKLAEASLENQIEAINNFHLSTLTPIKKMIASNPGHIPSMEEVAEAFNVSSRTLNRRLKAIGTNFKDTVSDVRKNMAIDYLRSSGRSVEEIAFLLSYNDTSNFSKAFKSWTGQSPSQYRETINRQE